MVFELLDENLASAISRFMAVFFSPCTLLLILGNFRKTGRRPKIIWLVKPKGRLPIHENIVVLTIA
jgi:hypothetical protein